MIADAADVHELRSGKSAEARAAGGRMASLVCLSKYVKSMPTRLKSPRLEAHLELLAALGLEVWVAGELRCDDRCSPVARCWPYVLSAAKASGCRPESP